MEKLKFLLVCLALGIMTSGMFAQAKKIEFEEFKLDNGLHVILHQDISIPIVVVSLMYHVGAKNESPDKTGFAHFFEHLMFEGSKHIERGEYTKHVEKAGGVLNANTSNDRTYYYELLPSNQLELGLWLESERMLHLKVDSIGIVTQKNVVIEEKKQSYDNRPYGSILIEIMKRAFTKHPYKWTTIGDAEHIRAATDDDFVNFYKTFYVPNNAVLILAGDIDKQNAKNLVNKYFGDIPKGTRPMYRPDRNLEPKQTKEIRDTVFDNIQLPAIIKAYKVPALGDADYYAVEMLNRVMSTGQSSRLNRKLVDKEQKALAVVSVSLPFEHPCIALVYALPNMGVDLTDLENAVDAEYDIIKKELISEAELQKLKNQIENEFTRQNITLAQRASNLATNYTYFKDANLVNTQIEKYLQVTAEDIRRVANEYFKKENRVVLYYLPKGSK
jgi:zinc protease